MALDATKIKAGPGHFYIDVTLPTSPNPLALVSGAPATGTELGLTDGEAVFTYEVEYFEVMADQVLPPVAVFAQAEHARLEFTMKEYEATKVKAALQQPALTIDNVSAPKTDTFNIGGETFEVTLRSIVLVSRIPNTSPQRYTIIMLYKAYQSENLALRVTKSGESLMKTTFVGIADLTRNVGDTVGQLVIQRN